MLLAPPPPAGERRVLPREGASAHVPGTVRGVDDELHRQVCREQLGQRAHLAPPQQGLDAPRPQDDLGARVGARCLRRCDGVGAVRCARPGPGLLSADPAGVQNDLVAHQETRQQSDAELAEEAPPSEAELVALGRRPDRGQDRADRLRVQTDPGVVNVQAPVVGHIRGDDLNPARTVRLDGNPGRDGVGAVLDKLPQIDPWAGVEMVGQQVDHAPQVHLETVSRHTHPPDPTRG